MEIFLLLLGHLFSYGFGILTVVTIDAINKRKAKKEKEKRDKKYPGFKVYEDIAHQAATLVSNSFLPKK